MPEPAPEELAEFKVLQAVVKEQRELAEQNQPPDTSGQITD
jgi:hypothetical protein